MRALLLVESSTTMRRVLGEHLRALGFEVDDVESHSEAIERLDERLRKFDQDYAGVVFGWPAVADPQADALSVRLEQSDVADLPVTVMSTDLRAETRAWVAARPRTAMVAWKQYRDVDSVLDRLVAPEEGTSPAAVKFDNKDIRLLIIDDSATIRRSLRDLFSQQGYVTLLASGAEAALDIAREERVDVAIVDFYLGDDTGDRVCRELVADPDTGDIVCAVLTGTYSDHIIRRSLRAGALECLFKYESSELLLNRVDALSRFVRQRRRLAEERQMLNRVVDMVGGAAVVIDREEAIRHVSTEALSALGHDDARVLIGRHLSVITGDGHVGLDRGSRDAIFRRADGATTDVSVARRSLGEELGSVLQFKLADAGERPGASTAPASPSAAAASDTDQSTPPPRRARGPIPPQAASFLSLLARIVDGREPVQQQASLLVLRLWLRDEADGTVPIGDHPDIETRLTPALLALYKRKDHVAALGDGRFGFLIRHVDAPQSWLVTRKIMQLANDSLSNGDEPRLASTASLKRIDDEVLGAAQCLARTLDALDYVDARWSDKALLVDPRRMLAVYPENPAGD